MEPAAEIRLKIILSITCTK